MIYNSEAYVRLNTAFINTSKIHPCSIRSRCHVQEKWEIYLYTMGMIPHAEESADQGSGPCN